MSFSNNCKPDKMPGPIQGNPLNGLTDRVSIQVQKVFDACMKQETLVDQTISVNDFTPREFECPLQFVSAKSTGEAIIRDLNIMDIPDSKCCSRVTANIEVPLTVVMLDANGNQVVGRSKVIIPKDITMCLTSGAVMPSRIVAEAHIMIPNGKLLSCKDDDKNESARAVFSVTACVTTIMKVVMDVQLLVPTYGYTFIPPCQEFSQDVCDGIFDLPLYPRECGKFND